MGHAFVPYFEDLMKRRDINGVEVSLVAAEQFLGRLLFIARKGIHMYGFSFPPPRKVLT